MVFYTRDGSTRQPMVLEIFYTHMIRKFHPIFYTTILDARLERISFFLSNFYEIALDFRRKKPQFVNSLNFFINTFERYVLERRRNSIKSDVSK